MTRKEAKRRLKYMARWWSPRVLRVDGPGCLLMVTLGHITPEWGSVSWLGAYGWGSKDWSPITEAWDRCDRAAALRAIEEL